MCISTAKTLTLPADNSCNDFSVDSNTEVNNSSSFVQDPVGTWNSVLSTRYFTKLCICRIRTLQFLLPAASLNNSNTSDCPCCDFDRKSKDINSASSSLLVPAVFSLGLTPVEGSTWQAVGACKAGRQSAAVSICICHVTSVLDISRPNKADIGKRNNVE